MDFIYKVEDRLLNELEEISTKIQDGEPISHDCLDDIKDISEALNNFSTYTAMKESGFSHDSGSYSNARGGQRRDSMGRYSRGGRYSRNSYGRMEDDWGREPYNMY